MSADAAQNIRTFDTDCDNDSSRSTQNLAAPRVSRAPATPAGLKIMGERNSGTNFASLVLHENVDLGQFSNSRGTSEDLAHLVRRSIFGFRHRSALQVALKDHQHHLSVPQCGGWKHAAATDRLLTDFAKARNAFVLFVVRHPVTWSQSMHRNPFHHLVRVPRNFSAFLRTTWVCAGRDELGDRVVSSPLDLYARKYESYRWFASQHTHSAILRYEDLLADPEEALDRIGLAAFRKSRLIQLPARSAREAGRGNLDLCGYRAKAAATSYAALSAGDRTFVTDRLAASGLLDLYPL